MVSATPEFSELEDPASFSFCSNSLLPGSNAITKLAPIISTLRISALCYGARRPRRRCISPTSRKAKTFSANTSPLTLSYNFLQTRKGANKCGMIDLASSEKCRTFVWRHWQWPQGQTAFVLMLAMPRWVRPPRSWTFARWGPTPGIRSRSICHL